MNSSPCKNCENAGCGAYHGQCEKYQQYVENNKARLKETYKDNILNSSHKRYFTMPKALKSKRGVRNDD